MENQKQKAKKENKRFIVILVSVILSALIVLEGSYKVGITTFSPSKFISQTFKISAINSSSTLVQFLAVGQGDCTIIKVKDKCIVIDFGLEDDRKTVYKALRRLGVEDIDLAVVTHLHKDHFGGFLNLHDQIKIKNIVVSKSGGDDTDEALAKEFFAKIEKHNINLIEPYVGLKETFESGSLEILYMDEKSREENNRSLFVSVIIDSVGFLFTGDASSDIEKDFLNKYPGFKTDFLKLGHHGSSSSSSDDFIEKLSPRLTVASCGYNNYYNHPSNKTISNLNDKNVKYLRTDLDGDITVDFLEDKVTITTKRR